MYLIDNGALLSGIDCKYAHYLRRVSQVLGFTKVKGRLNNGSIYPGFVSDYEVSGELCSVADGTVTPLFDEDADVPILFIRSHHPVLSDD